MSISTDIQWCDSTVNPTMGCDGCEIWNPQRKSCYAGILHRLRGGTNPGFSPKFEILTLFPGRMADAARWPDLRGRSRNGKPWLDGLPRMIFVSDMSDALSRSVPFEFLYAEIVANVESARGRRHKWLWLTKQPARMVEFANWLEDFGFRWPGNLWVGTSITTQPTAGRIKHLLQVGDAETTRFLSVEPQIEPIDVTKWLSKLDWAIIGGESGDNARPFKLEWARHLLRQCRQSRVPAFVKQLGANVVDRGRKVRLADSHGGDWDEWPDAKLRVREMPEQTLTTNKF